MVLLRPTPTQEEPRSIKNAEVIQAAHSSSTSAPSLIARDDIKLMETLGEGTFAVVKRAVWRRPGSQAVDCAVKILHDMSEEVRKDLHDEVLLLLVSLSQ